jgi:hypothetical protein
VRLLLRTIGGDFIEPIDQLGVASAFFNQMLHPIATSAAAFGTVDIQHVKFADEITEYDCAIAGHQ